ncbi:MAG: capsule assembly Wzi family protein [Spirochaetaceae bacterium]|jgi:hypothetical protein|nr:capsule assembly Wzi family protein [Spirochaetaceae bacterium]
MINIKNKILIFFSVFSVPLYCQEALKSTQEDYYDFLSLNAVVKRPYLNYRTLSDSVWKAPESAEDGTAISRHVWNGINLGELRALSKNVSLRVYGPELFASFNTNSPYGQNDGALWQGRGFNSSLSAGAHLRAFGIEAVFKPQVSFSQNLAFDYLKPGAFVDAVYKDKAAVYGYYGGYQTDVPQRFGDDPFFTFDWGDSEIRYTWKTLTIGFGTQTPWLGSAYLNPIIHSNNAPSYPKLDLGLRRQPVVLPFLDWYLGDVEARMWLGRLSESDYYDDRPSNDYFMLHAFSLAYAPAFIPGFVLSVNRISISPWKLENLKYIKPTGQDSNTGIDDQKGSAAISWVFQKVGLEIYGELGIDDFVFGKLTGYIRYPFHTMVYTAGLKKTVDISPKKSLYGELILELNNMEASQNFQFWWPYSFYSHSYELSYAQKGQILGAGSGGGGNSQLLMFKVFYPKGTASVFVHRVNPDNNFVYAQAVNQNANGELTKKYAGGFRADLTFGISALYFLRNNISLGGGFSYTYIINPYYFYADITREPFKILGDIEKNNFSFNFVFKFNL